MPSVLDSVRASAQPITGAETDYDSLLTFIGDASFVLLGEASHGTHEFYRSRAQITQRLIREKGFSAVEADWPDAYRVASRHLQHLYMSPTIFRCLGRLALNAYRTKQIVLGLLLLAKRQQESSAWSETSTLMELSNRSEKAATFMTIPEFSGHAVVRSVASSFPKGMISKIASNNAPGG